MPAFSPEILTRLRVALSSCSQLRDDATLRTLFTDARINPWANELPNAIRASDRIGFVIDTLGDRTHADYHENALVLFLYVLRDNVDRRDTRHAELDALARDLSTARPAMPAFQPTAPNSHSPDSDRDSLNRQLSRARRTLHILEEQAAGFGALHIPAHLQIELEEQRELVATLEARLR